MVSIYTNEPQINNLFYELEVQTGLYFLTFHHGSGSTHRPLPKPRQKREQESSSFCFEFLISFKMMKKSIGQLRKKKFLFSSPLCRFVANSKPFWKSLTNDTSLNKGVNIFVGLNFMCVVCACSMLIVNSSVHGAVQWVSASVIEVCSVCLYFGLLYTFPLLSFN